MPGRHVTDRQKRLFMTLKKTHTIDAAAAKAGFSRATGYRLAEDPSLLSGKAAPRGRRRPDPLADIFETEVVPILENSPGIRSVGGFEALMQRHMYRCDGCGREHPLHNSCRNRHCPTCQGLAATPDGTRLPAGATQRSNGHGRFAPSSTPTLTGRFPASPFGLNPFAVCLR